MRIVLPLLTLALALPLSGQRPEALTRVPSGFRNALHVADIAPVIRAVLDDDAVGGVLAEFGLAARSLQQQFDLVEAYVPKSAVLACPPGTARSVARFLRGLVAAELVWGLHSTETLEPIEDMQREVLSAIEDVFVAQLHVEIETRAERVAETWFEGIGDGFQELAAQVPGSRVEFSGDTVVWTLTPPEALVDELLVNFGAALGPGDPWLEKVHAALRQRPVRIAAHLIDSGLRFALGDVPASSLAETDLRPLTDDGAGVGEGPTLAVAQWDLRPMLAEFRAAAALWERWKPTKAGAFVVQYDEEDFYGSIEDLRHQAETVPATGALRLELGERSLELQMQEDQGVGYRPLASTPIARIAAVAPMIVASGDRFGDRLVGSLRGFEDQLANRQLQAELRVRTEQARMLQGVADAYYHDMATSRTLLVDHARDWFANGWLAIADTGTAVIAPPDAAADEGLSKATPAVAAIATVAQGTSADEILDRLFGAMAADLEIEPSRCRGDLGLDRSVHLLPEDVWRAARIRGDLQLHGFALGDLIVLSTAPSLSRRLVDAFDAGTVAPWAEDESLAANWSASSAAVQAIVAAVEDWLGAELGNDEVFRQLGRACDLFESFASRSTLSPRGLRTTASLRFGR